MANAGFGQFAGSFADSFTRAMALSQENKRRDELAKLQAKLVEAQLKSGEIKLNAQTTMADILTGTIEEFEPAAPQISPGGREIPQFTNESRVPQNLIEALTTNPEFQAAAVQSGSLRLNDLLDFKTAQDQLAAQPDINQLMGNLAPDESGNPPFILGEIKFGPRGPEQSFIRNPEFSTKRQDDLSRSSLSQLTTDVLEAISIGSDIEGSLLESGFPFGEQARTGKSALATIGGVLGFDTKAQKQDVAKRDRLEKLNGMILNLRIKRLIDAGENITNDKLAFQQSISPSNDKRFEANVLLYADFLQEELNRVDIEGPEVSASERKKVLDIIRKARSGEFLQTDQEPVVDGPGLLESAGQFASSTMEQLQSIDIPSLPPEQIESFRARFNELKQQAADVSIPNITVPDVVKMNFEQLQQTDFSGMADNLKNAAIKRYQQLEDLSKPFLKSALDKVKAGFATAKDFAELTIEDIKKIDEEDIKKWTKQQVNAFNKRRKELGL